MEMDRERKQIRIKGIVIPVEWDAEGNAIKAAISVSNEKEYLIEDDKNLEQFLGYPTGSGRKRHGQRGSRPENNHR